MPDNKLLQEIKDELENNMEDIDKLFEMKKEVNALWDRTKPAVDSVFSINAAIRRGIETRHKQQGIQGGLLDDLLVDIEVESIMNEMAMEKEWLQRDIKKVDTLFEMERKVNPLEDRLKPVIDKMAFVAELELRIRKS